MTPTVKKITSHTEVVEIGARRCRSRVWVGRGEVPADQDPEDRTMPVVTHAYLTRRGLVAAIKTGAAFQ